MDDRLKRALEFSNYRATLQQQREILKLKVNNLLTYSTKGGTFRINQELLGYVLGLLNHGVKETVLFDVNFIPILIENLEIFFNEIFELYNEASLEYLKEYEKLKKARTTKSLVNFEEAI